MSEINIIEGQLRLDSPARFGIIAARFNSFIVERLLEACLDTLERMGVAQSDITLVRVPGAFEMPTAARRMAESGNYDVLIALGAVIRGATPHFDFVAGECSKGLAAVSACSGVPLAFGVLTVDSIEQAIERAGTKAGNKGADAAQTAIEMVSLLRALG